MGRAKEMGMHRRAYEIYEDAFSNREECKEKIRVADSTLME